MESITCANCGITWGMDPGHITQLRDCKNYFYCPAGHRLSFGGKSRKQLENENGMLEAKIESQKARVKYWADKFTSERNSRIAFQGHLTRMKREREKVNGR